MLISTCIFSSNFFSQNFFFRKFFPYLGEHFSKTFFLKFRKFSGWHFFFISNFEFLILEMRLPFRSFFFSNFLFFSNFIGNQSLKSIQTVLAFFFDFQFSYIGLSAIFSGMGCWKLLYPYKYAPKYPEKLFFLPKMKVFLWKDIFQKLFNEKKRIWYFCGLIHIKAVFSNRDSVPCLPKRRGATQIYYSVHVDVSCM